MKFQRYIDFFKGFGLGSEGREDSSDTQEMVGFPSSLSLDLGFFRNSIS